MKFLASLTKAPEHQRAAPERHKLQSSSTQTELHLGLKGTIYRIPYTWIPKTKHKLWVSFIWASLCSNSTTQTYLIFLLEGIMWTLLKLNVKGQWKHDYLEEPFPKKPASIKQTMDNVLILIMQNICLICKLLAWQQQVYFIMHELPNWNKSLWSCVQTNLILSWLVLLFNILFWWIKKGWEVSFGNLSQTTALYINDKR